MELNTIKQKGTWGDTATALNENFAKVTVEVGKLSYSTTRSKGLYLSETALKAQCPNPSVGDWAVIGTTIPGRIWRCEVNGIWKDAGTTGGGADVNLTEYATKQDLDSVGKRIDAMEPVVLTEAAYQAITSPAQNKFYYTYEEG